MTDPLRLTDEQQKFVTETLALADKLKGKGAQAATDKGLTGLALFYQEAGNILEHGIEYQCKLIRESLVNQTTETEVKKEPSPQMEALTKAVTDTAKRRGLFDDVK